MPSSDAVRVKTDELPVGIRLSHPINDGEDRLLLAAGVLLTARLKERLIARGVSEVLLHPDDVAALFGKHQPTHVRSPRAAGRPTKKKKSPRPATSEPSLQGTVAQIRAQASALAASVSRQIKNSGPPLSERQVSHGTTPL